METIQDVLEHMDRAGEVSVNLLDAHGRPLAVVVRVRSDRLSTAQRLAVELRAGGWDKKKGRTPKGTARSRRQRQAAKHARLRKGDA